MWLHVQDSFLEMGWIARSKSLCVAHSHGRNSCQVPLYGSGSHSPSFHEAWELDCSCSQLLLWKCSNALTNWRSSPEHLCSLHGAPMAAIFLINFLLSLSPFRLELFINWRHPVILPFNTHLRLRPRSSWYNAIITLKRSQQFHSVTHYRGCIWFSQLSQSYSVVLDFVSFQPRMDYFSNFTFFVSPILVMDSAPRKSLTSYKNDRLVFHVHYLQGFTSVGF